VWDEHPDVWVSCCTLQTSEYTVRIPGNEW
jgi:hypothetical protein